MSSSNRVRLAYIEEAIYGETPAGDFNQVKFTSEDLTGTPKTSESAEIRSDRQNSGQVNTGLEMSGGFNFELSADTSIQFFIEQAMMSDPTVAAVHTDNLSINALGKLITTNGDFVADGIEAGDIIVTNGFATAANNTALLVDTVVAGTISYIGGEDISTEVSVAGASVTVPPYHEIGTVEKSCSLSKEFLDIVDPLARSVAYTGIRAGEMGMNFTFGEIVTGNFSLAGNGYDQPALPITAGRTVTPSGSDQALDASNSFSFMTINGADANVCIENLSFTLNNNLKPQNCIGKLAPTDQIPGSAKISFESKIHLGINSWDLFMQAKLTQTPVSIAFATIDSISNKGYGVAIHRVQLNFPDPNSQGKDETVTIDATGSASYDEAEANTMRIYLIG